MASPQSKLTAQGQVSVPAEVRRKLGLGAGSVLEWEEHQNHFVVRRAGRYSSSDIHHALFSDRRVVPRSLADLKDGIRKHIRKRYAGR